MLDINSNKIVTKIKRNKSNIDTKKARTFLLINLILTKYKKQRAR